MTASFIISSSEQHRVSPGVRIMTIATFRVRIDGVPRVLLQLTCIVALAAQLAIRFFLQHVASR
jgi:hypothetical protein